MLLSTQWLPSYISNVSTYCIGNLSAGSHYLTPDFHVPFKDGALTGIKPFMEQILNY